MGLFNSLFGSNYREIYFKNNPPSTNGTYTCKACGRELDKNDSDLTIDHIVPRKYGGTNAVINLQVLCRSCNSKKKAKINTLTLEYSGKALIREIKNLV